MHFFLSIARQLDLPEDDLYVYQDELEGETAVLFTELLHCVGLINGHLFLLQKPDDYREHQRNYFRAALGLFYDLGEQRFGFTFEQIAEAYIQKNRINHERQASGY
jgi:dimeric dUTPase (all-alpha-NTP-PPase superfamily)